MRNALTLFYLGCFAACGWPSVIRMMRRRSSADLSIWREILLLAGVCAQFAVMVLTGANWRVWLSPINTCVSVATALGAILWYRRWPG